MGNKKPKVVATLARQVIERFELYDFEEGQPIYCGESNIEHMKKGHEKDFERYGQYIGEIITNPTYIAKHPNKPSIEYIKEIVTDDNELVLVAVRASTSKKLFARTLFVMDQDKVKKYREKGALIPYIEE